MDEARREAGGAGGGRDGAVVLAGALDGDDQVAPVVRAPGGAGAVAGGPQVAARGGRVAGSGRVRP